MSIFFRLPSGMPVIHFLRGDRGNLCSHCLGSTENCAFFSYGDVSACLRCVRNAKKQDMACRQCAWIKEDPLEASCKMCGYSNLKRFTASVFEDLGKLLKDGKKNTKESKQEALEEICRKIGRDGLTKVLPREQIDFLLTAGGAKKIPEKPKRFCSPGLCLEPPHRCTGACLEPEAIEKKEDVDMKELFAQLDSMAASSHLEEVEMCEDNDEMWTPWLKLD